MDSVSFSARRVTCRRRKLFPKFGMCVLMRASRPHEGRSRSSRTWCGLRWTRRASRRSMRARTVKPCGPVPSTLGSSLFEMIGARRWLKSPTHRGEHGAAVKPLRRECRSVSALPVYLVCVFSFCTQACGCGQRPAFPAPSHFRRAENTQHSDANRAAGIRFVFSRCRAPRRRSTQILPEALSGC